MADDETETSTQEGEASPPPADDSAKTPDSPEAAPAEPQTPELDEEQQKRVDEVIGQVADTHFPEAAPSEEEKVTLTTAELVERDRRNRQGGRDEGKAETQVQRDAREEAQRQEGQRRAQLRQQIELLAKTSLDANGEIRPDFADEVLAAHEGTIFQRAEANAIAQQDQTLVQAARNAEFMQNAKPEDWAPMQTPARNRLEEVGQLLEVAHNVGRSAMKAEMEASIERRVNALARPKAEAMTKEALAKLRVGAPNGELPVGSPPPSTTLTTERYQAMTAEERRKLSPDQIDAMTRRRMGVA